MKEIRMTDSHGGMAGCMHGRRGHVLWLTTRLVLIRALYFCIGGNYLGVYFFVGDIILYEEIYYTNVGNFKRYYIILLYMLYMLCMIV